MIQDRRKFLDMIYNILWLYGILIVSQLILYFYYPNYFTIYEVFITYLYSMVKSIFDFASTIIANVFDNFGSIIILFGILILVFTFYQIFMKITTKIIKGGQ